MTKLLKGYVKRYLPQLILSYAALLAEAALAVIVPIFLSNMLNLGTECTRNDLVIFLAVSLGYVCVKCAKDCLINYVTNYICTDMTSDYVMKMADASLLDLYGMERVSGVYTVSNMCFFVPAFFLQEIPEVAVAIVKGIVLVVILLQMNVPLALAAILLTVVQFIIKQKLLTQDYKAMLSSTEATTQFEQKTHDWLTNFKCVFTNHMQERIQKHIASEKRGLLSALRKKSFWENINQAEDHLFTNGVYLIAVVAICALALSGGVQLGDYELYLSYILLLLGCMNMVYEGMQVKNQTDAMYQLYLDVAVAAETSGTHFEQTVDCIRLQDVNFGYDEDKPVLEKFNQSFEKGKLYVIKGGNGSGKSTLINLICGLFTPQSGKVLVNGTDLNTWDKRRYLASQIAISDQQTSLLFDSVAENIATGENGEAAARQAAQYWGIGKLWDDELHAGYSGGEMQKIGLARMMYQIDTQNTGIVILDEPMNNLDVESKARLLDFLKEKKEERIVLVISHEDTLEELADEVIHLDAHGASV